MTHVVIGGSRGREPPALSTSDHGFQDLDVNVGSGLAITHLTGHSQSPRAAHSTSPSMYTIRGFRRIRGRVRTYSGASLGTVAVSFKGLFTFDKNRCGERHEHGRIEERGGEVVA